MNAMTESVMSDKDEIHKQALLTGLPYMPECEREHLTETYHQARVILEYGSGGSTEVAARMPGKYVMSVESDRGWARDLRNRLVGAECLSPVVVHHVDIGQTGLWGRPLDDRCWRDFHLYPNDVWEQGWFRPPDTILIDGRFRTACLATVLLRTEQPVRVLFDDYLVRPLYQQVERIVRPIRLIGRMAEFEIEPGQVRPSEIGFLISQFFQASIHGMGEKYYAGNLAIAANETTRKAE